MKKFILDTDMGVDCDDAVALALLINYKKAGACEILGVTASSTREGATATIRTICDYYKEDFPIGAMALPALACDNTNNYGKYIKDFYVQSDETMEAVALIRKLLSQTEEKAEIIAIGPLTNIARLLRSKADHFSALCGVELVREKVSAMYVMGGSFTQNYGRAGIENQQPFGEWNILQDVESAKYVTENFPSKIIFCPHEAGDKVLTDMQSGNNPVWACMKQYAISEGFSYQPVFRRPSWDPITCLCALEQEADYFERSELGKVIVGIDGTTTFHASENGNVRILLNKENYLEIADRINGFIEPISES